MVWKKERKKERKQRIKITRKTVGGNEQKKNKNVNIHNQVDVQYRKEAMQCAEMWENIKKHPTTRK